MRFPRFWQRPARKAGDEASLDARSWQDSGLADEVEAFLAGGLAEHMTYRGRTVPSWAALNRLAHADGQELRAVVEGTQDRWAARPFGRPWAAAERFLAGRLLARAGSEHEVSWTQRTVLIPLELRLIERAKTTSFTPEQVLDAGAEALDAASSDH
jgi:hypothetical protein